MSEKSSMRVLNVKEIEDTSKRSAVEISKEMQKTMLKLKGEFIIEDGKGVNYAGIKGSKMFKDYFENLAPQLQYVDLGMVSENEKKAFFINVYNALTIHGLVERTELPQSVLKVEQFWNTTAYNIGGLVYSLDDIEHGILRSNRSHPSSVHPTFKKGDPRLKYIVKELDPRIHFALVCGAKSCPAINVYTAMNLDRALDAATQAFCAQEVSMFTEVDEIWLSRIFQWYSQDFGNTDIDVINSVIQRIKRLYYSPQLRRPVKDLGQMDNTIP
ncbi:uncharacterized protein LOC128230606 isoform X2 [Mya arenaria]|uniref:uncharacterized protein LOC128230606 isoform X2 n=1 Tax=Mya arenaria TaxID=6604 RepID=UPI0022E6E81F|nr:uncharacterized protein LOC128230606 isoform X2 [Mya arenaria]